MARQKWIVRKAAWAWTEWLITLFNYYELGCPKSAQEYSARLGCWRFSADQKFVVDRLFQRLVDVCGVKAQADWTRGRKTLLEALDGLEREHVKSGDPLSSLFVPPIEVDPERISVPDRAGGCDPRNHLCPEKLAIYNNLEHLKKDESDWELPLPKPCIMISKDNEQLLRHRLLAADMAELIEESNVPCDGRGRKILSGLFAVAHKASSDRLIIDRRPANRTEGRLGWARLPHGTLLCKIRLPPDKTLRGSADDLQNYFYQLASPSEIRERSSFGRVFTGQQALDLGGDPLKRYHMCLSVWAMGDQNAVCVAQETHEAVLRGADCLAEPTRLEYDRPLGVGELWEGAYIDDHLVIAVVPRSRPRAAGPDRALIERSHSAYRAASLPVSVQKRFTEQSSFVAWGTSVCAETGRVGISFDRLAQLFLLSFQALCCRALSKGVLQSLLGSYVHPFMHRRACMCTLGQIFGYTSSLDERHAATLPATIADELLSAALVLGVSDANIRAPVSSTIHCSDATPSRVGTVEGTVARTMAEGLYDYSEHRGRYVRLDWSSLQDVLHPWDHAEPPPQLQQALRGVHWREGRNQDLKHSDHVNITEAKAAQLVLRDVCKKSLAAERAVCGVDSRVLLGAWGKGRSSAGKLNQVLRGNLGWAILGQKEMKLFWVASKENPADDPSRDVPLRRPRSLPSSLAPLVLGERTTTATGCRGARHPDCYCLELFSGRGGLSAALSKKGLGVGTPYEAFPAAGRYVAHFDLDNDDVYYALVDCVKAGKYWYLHFGIPCSSWSCLQQLNKGTRSLDRPAGNGTLEREQKGNQQAVRVAFLCNLQIQLGRFYSIENPHSSYLWKFVPIVELLGQEVRFDQCAYGLRPPPAVGFPSSRIKKGTILKTNMIELSSLARACQNDHKHFRCIGSVKTKSGWISVAKAAGAYPSALCDAWAGLVQTAAISFFCDGGGGRTSTTPGTSAPPAWAR